MRRRTAAGLVDALTAAATGGAEAASGGVPPADEASGEEGDWETGEAGHQETGEAGHGERGVTGNEETAIPAGEGERERGFRAVEVGVGHRIDVAAGLAERGFAVVATDVHERAVPEGVDFVVDDVTEPDRSVYAGAALVYGLNLPAELQRPTVRVARAVGAACRFTTLGAEQPVVAATPTTLPGETLYAPGAPR